MHSQRNVGRWLGALLLAHLPVGLTVPYILLIPVMLPPGFLANAPGNASRVHAAVLLMFAGSAIALGASILTLPVFLRYSRMLAIWLVTLAVVTFALQGVDSGAILSMLSIGQQSVEANADAALYQAAAVAVGAARKWAHYTHLLVLGGWLLMLHVLLLRTALVPRALALLGLVAASSQIVGVTLRGLLGYPPVTEMAMPLAGTYLALGLWLTIKGFRDSRRLRSDGALAARSAF